MNNQENNLFEHGSIVMLKSGGAIMTTGEYVSKNELTCIWFCNNELNRGKFHENQLKLSQTQKHNVELW